MQVVQVSGGAAHIPSCFSRITQQACTAQLIVQLVAAKCLRPTPILPAPSKTPSLPPTPFNLPRAQLGNCLAAVATVFLAAPNKRPSLPPPPCDCLAGCFQQAALFPPTPPI
eukprot:365263-Chlamydomonas_euryale.AAC.13